MAQNRLPIIAGIIAILAFLLYSATFIVSERQQAIVLRFGQIVSVKTEPGIYFKLPFGFLDADTVQMIDDRLLRFDLDDIRVLVLRCGQCADDREPRASFRPRQYPRSGFGRQVL
jgi:membrane protease subunit HflC